MEGVCGGLEVLKDEADEDMVECTLPEREAVDVSPCKRDLFPPPAGCAASCAREIGEREIE